MAPPIIKEYEKPTGRTFIGEQRNRIVKNYPSLTKGDNGNEMEMPEDRPRNLIPGGDKFKPEINTVKCH